MSAGLLIALGMLAALIVVGFVLWLLDKRSKKDATPDSAPAEAEECCGQHDVCERDSLLAAAGEPVEYFDDEELDRFKGCAPETYTEDDSEEFRGILLSMRADEVAAWSRSLQLRGIELPTDVREELLMIVAERRQNTLSNA